MIAFTKTRNKENIVRKINLMGKVNIWMELITDALKASLIAFKL